MSITYNAAVKTARITATRDYFANGTLEILTSGDSVLATLGLSDTGGTISGAVWTMVFDNSTVTATGTGTAAKAQVKTSGGNAHLTGLTVGTSGTDIVVNSTSITSGQSFTMTSATITHV